MKIKTLLLAVTAVCAMMLTSCTKEEIPEIATEKEFKVEIPQTRALIPSLEIAINIPQNKIVTVYDKTVDADGKIPAEGAKEYTYDLSKDRAFVASLWGLRDTSDGLYYWYYLTWNLLTHNGGNLQ